QCTYMRWRHPEDELASGFGLEHLAATVETYRILKASGADSRCRVPEHDVDRRGLPLQAAVFVLPPTSTRTRRISPCGLHPPASYPRGRPRPAWLRCHERLWQGETGPIGHL